MNLHSGNTYIAIFFIYGLAFFSLGITVLQQITGTTSTLPILDKVKYLGLFGIVHGITEWIILIIISKAYIELRSSLFLIVIMLNNISFFFLWLYGIHAMNYKGKYKNIFNTTPYLVFLVWTGVFLYELFTFLVTGEFNLMLSDTLGRYFLGFTSAIITAMAFNKNSRAMRQLNYNKISRSFKLLFISFLAYGILAGLFVRHADFFPANIINSTLFKNIFYIPVELARAIVAILITLEFIKVMNVFRIEANSKMDKLKEHHIASEERRKLGRELHDVIIQNLFASGLQVEALLTDEEHPVKKKTLIDVKDNLNSVIFLIRDFIAKVSKQNFEFDDLRLKLEDLINRLKSNSSISINLEYNLPDVNLGTLTSETTSQVYYIIQEAIINALKHSQGDCITISLTSNLQFFIATIEDNGRGFIYSGHDSHSGYGIRSMKERAELFDGILRIDSKKGTIVTLNIPWEGCSDEETC